MLVNLITPQPPLICCCWICPTGVTAPQMTVLRTVPRLCWHGLHRLFHVTLSAQSSQHRPRLGWATGLHQVQGCAHWPCVGSFTGFVLRGVVWNGFPTAALMAVTHHTLTCDPSARLPGSYSGIKSQRCMQNANPVIFLCLKSSEYPLPPDSQGTVQAPHSYC